MKINLSSRERKLLMLLGGLVILFVVYKFIFLPTTTNYRFALEEHTKYLSEENELKSNILDEKAMKEKIEALKKENKDLAIKLPPEIHQENIIMDVIDIFGKHEVELLSMTFDDENRLDEKSDIQSVDDALQIYEDSMKVNSDKMGSLANILKKDETKEEVVEEKEEDKIKYLLLSISCESKYDNIKKLLLDITETRNIIITKNITLSKSTDSLDKLVCSLELNFPYYDDNSKVELPVWEDTNNKDKNILPFNYYVPGSELDPYIIKMKEATDFGSYVNNMTTIGGNASSTQEDKTDFYVILKPKESDNFAFTIGKSYERPNALHSDLNNESLQFIFEKKDGLYYYSMGTTLRPIDNKYIPAEFTPNSGKLIVSVQSQPRLGTGDTAFATLNIINRTDMDVEVQVKNEDNVYPRISVKAKEGSVNVKMVE